LVDEIELIFGWSADLFFTSLAGAVGCVGNAGGGGGRFPRAVGRPPLWAGFP